MIVGELPVSSLRLDPERFQPRATDYAESVAAAIRQVGWRQEKSGLIHVWPDETGEYWVLDGHSRMRGIEQLQEADRPETVRVSIHDELDEEGAIDLANELNASRSPLTTTEMAEVASIAYEKMRQKHPSETDDWIYEQLASRFAGVNPRTLRKNVVMVYLPARVREMVDDEDFPHTAARALGRFIRDTGLDAERATQLAGSFFRGGMNVSEFVQYLSENQCTIARSAQSDMFGEIVDVQMRATQKLKSAVLEAEHRLREIRSRRLVFSALEGTEYEATKAQRRLLAEDSKAQRQVQLDVEEARRQLDRAMRFGALTK